MKLVAMILKIKTFEYEYLNIDTRIFKVRKGSNNEKNLKIKMFNFAVWI